ncbi:MAG TPA: MarC family protein [Rhizomicrobium sp.]|nr:MarC family protein [Rhizomicrobium sp.]
MNIFGNAFLLVYAGLFPIVNPIGSAPLFLGLTEFCTTDQRNNLAFRVALNSFLLLLGSMFIGSHVLEFFGISLPVVRIGGGLIVTAFGWKLLNSETTPDTSRADATGVHTVPESFYPLTMPLTVGPGSIAVAIGLGSQRPKGDDMTELLLLGGGALVGLIAIALTIYFSYRFAQRLVSVLGTSGTHVVIRLSAFILVCIGIQILWSGWSELSSLPH